MAAAVFAAHALLAFFGGEDIAVPRERVAT